MSPRRGAVVTALSVAQALWTGDARFLLGTVLGAGWVRWPSPAGVGRREAPSLDRVVRSGAVVRYGLGPVVVRAVTQLDIASGFEGGLAVVLLAIYLDRLTSALAERDRPGLLTRLRRPVGARPAAAAESAADPDLAQEAPAPADLVAQR